MLRKMVAGVEGVELRGTAERAQLQTFLRQPWVQNSPCWCSAFPKRGQPPRGVIVRLAAALDMALRPTCEGNGWDHDRQYAAEVLV